MPESRHRRRRGRAAPSRGRGAQSLAISRPRPKKNSWLYIAASAVIAFLVIAGFAVGSAGFGHGGGITRGGSANQFVEGIGEEHDIMLTANHVAESQTVDYSTVPPTSGDHWARWARCGFYEHQVPDERITHNLEHGNIVVSYNLATQEEVDELRRVFDDIGPSTLWGVARSYDKIAEGTVVLTTWGVMDTMQGIDAERMEAFFDAYAGSLGPERVDCLQGGVMDPPPAGS